jgi:cystathionine gamma-synthase
MTHNFASADSALVHAGAPWVLGEPVSQQPVLSTILASVGEPGAADYGRGGNRTWATLERALGAVEDAEAVVFSSGQAASMALMLATAVGRDKILLPAGGYYNARALADRLRPHGAEPVLVDLQDLAAVERELGGSRAVLWAESPTNPLLRVADLARLGALAAAAGAPMIVDNTVATGLLQQPLDLGAAASLCSLTKSASGHSDVLAGAVMTRDEELAASLRTWRTLGGGLLGPMEAWLVIRGLKTLPLRLERQSANALEIARHLAVQPRVSAVHYPGLREDIGVAGCGLGQRAERGSRAEVQWLLQQPGGDGTAATADAVFAASRLVIPATSFGGAETSWERRGRWPGETAPPSLIRLSAGIEPAADIISDIDHALAATG